MNLGHLGDAFDYWKGIMINHLRGADEDISLLVVPLFTDYSREAWTPQRLELYAKLLGFHSPDKVMMSDMNFGGSKKERKIYWEELKNRLSKKDMPVDIFLDPDTGIKPGETSSSVHICAQEVGELTRLKFVRFVMVYDQSKDHKLKERLHNEVLIAGLAKNKARGLICSCGQVRMVVATGIEKSLELVRKNLRKLFDGQLDYYVQSRTYQYLEPRSGSRLRQLFVKGSKLRAETLYRETVGEDPRTPQQVACDFQVPIEAVLESVDYCVDYQELLCKEREEERVRLQEFEKKHPPVLPPDYVPQA